MQNKGAPFPSVGDETVGDLYPMGNVLWLCPTVITTTGGDSSRQSALLPCVCPVSNCHPGSVIDCVNRLKEKGKRAKGELENEYVTILLSRKRKLTLIYSSTS